MSNASQNGSVPDPDVVQRCTRVYPQRTSGREHRDIIIGLRLSRRMFYKELLQYLQAVYGSNEFTAADLASLLIIQNVNRLPWTDPRKITKRASGDLVRLYHMKFLNRRPVKRPIKGRNYNRGRQYLFRINQQGRDYLEYMRNPDESIRRRNSGSFRDWIDMIMISKLRDKLPEEFKPNARILHDSLFGKTPIRPIDRRFPIHRDFEMVTLVNKLLEENHTLRTELSELQKSKDQLDMLYHDKLEHLEKRASDM